MDVPRMLIVLLLDVASLLILAEVIVSWSMHLGARGIRAGDPWVRTLRRATAPMLQPFQRLIPAHRTNGLDLSPMLALLTIQVLQSVFGGSIF